MTAAWLEARFFATAPLCERAKPVTIVGMHAFEFLEQKSTEPAAGLWVAYGDDRFLKQRVIRCWVERIYGAEADVGPRRLEGPQATWGDVATDVTAVSLFGPAISAVVIEDADKFVSENRDQLTRWCDSHSQRSYLLLDVASWPGNTKLAQATNQQGRSIHCGMPQKKPAKGRASDDTAAAARWLQAHARANYELDLSADLTQQLMRHGEPDFGLWDQHLCKLSLFVDDEHPPTAQMIDEVIGGWRNRTAFEMIDAALAGNATDALLQLDRLLQAGEAPLALFAAMSYTLRQYNAAVQVIEGMEARGGKANLRQAIQQVGVMQFKQAAMEKCLRRLGRQRAAQLYRRLLEIDLALKGSHSTPARGRWLFEQLIFWLASPPPQPRVKT